MAWPSTLTAPTLVPWPPCPARRALCVGIFGGDSKWFIPAKEPGTVAAVLPRTDSAQALLDRIDSLASIAARFPGLYEAEFDVAVLPQTESRARSLLLPLLGNRPAVFVKADGAEASPTDTLARRVHAYLTSLIRRHTRERN